MRLLLILLGIGLIGFAAFAIWQPIEKGNWEDFIAEIILCAGGVLMYWFSDEFSSYSRKYSEERDFFKSPENYYKLGGLLITVVCGIYLLAGKNLG